ncbi:hypothetical protein AVEN_6837-1 [Araneus ventricosus]|uniref:Uncharacterized protein n=1 Tax=Araneus ventricosus TaxID=182803 RepID=A0A4Y2WHV6_ARAVE|nr:hypothetical protein AVEN_6837-1 [Araneus ventricosus]
MDGTQSVWRDVGWWDGLSIFSTKELDETVWMRTESVLGAAIRLERKRFRTKTRVNTVTRYYGTIRRFAGETGAASLGNDETSATRSGYMTLPRKCEQRH